MPNSKNNPPSTKKKDDLLPHGFKAKAERISAEYRNYVGLKEFDPLPSVILTNYLKLIVIKIPEIPGITSEEINAVLSDFSGAFSAVTIYCVSNNRHMIVHNHTHSQARQESNIMHECAHLILGHKMEEFDNSHGFPLRSYDSVQEAEANYLGFCLQLPKAAFTKHYVYGNNTQEQMAQLFNASLEVVRYRIGRCGIEKFKKKCI